MAACLSATLIKRTPRQSKGDSPTYVNNILHVFTLPVVVAINRFPGDTEKEISTLMRLCKEFEFKTVIADGYAKGGSGMTDLAKMVVNLCDMYSVMSHPYDMDRSIEDKIRGVAVHVYGAGDVNFLPRAKKQIAELERLGFSNLPVCIAKTQYSLSDNPELICAPIGFTITVKNVKVSSGAGFIVVLTAIL